MAPVHRGACRVDAAQRAQLDTRPDVLVARRASGQWGVVSFDELLACGLSRRAVAERVRTGRLHRIHRGVYAVGHPGLPAEGRFLAALKACGPGAVLSHFSAAALFGLLDPEDRYPEVTVLGTATRVHRGVRVHRTCALDPADVTRRGGLPATSPARTLLDLAPALEYRGLRRVVGQAQSLHLVNVPAILEVLGRLGPRPGARTLARIVAAGPAPTRSALEDAVLELMLAGGLARPDVNVPIVVAGRRVIPDFRWPCRRLIVEADGAAWHGHRSAREDDAERQALLESHGERVLRVTWEQAVARRGETLARLRAAGAPAGPD